MFVFLNNTDVHSIVPDSASSYDVAELDDEIGPAGGCESVMLAVSRLRRGGVPLVTQVSFGVRVSGARGHTGTRGGFSDLLLRCQMLLNLPGLFLNFFSSLLSLLRQSQRARSGLVSGSN